MKLIDNLFAAVVTLRTPKTLYHTVLYYIFILLCAILILYLEQLRIVFERYYLIFNF